ncbi:uncharacterized protein LOC129329026 [Eublepharis macularius]|uniref:Uncharacterized protein LOC129329026 n=1 Tax=Eublepharis macularius TaxID=481883 RepID=A0AA97JA18_EUBMA|nr:uncharacterized protein LOC129329026 [Eublepharis macularius]
MTHSHRAANMRGVLRSFTTSFCALAALFLSLQLCVAKSIYAEKGSSVELLCPCSHCSEEVNWYFNWKGTTTQLFCKKKGKVKRYPSAWDRLEMLPNNSLRISNVADNDTWRYWCEPSYYYDLVVVTGTKQTVESKRADSVCYILSCSVSSDENLRHSEVKWWEGKKELPDGEKKGGVGIFKGKWASQLHICLKKETAGNRERMKTKERTVKCTFADQMGITFNLTGVTKDCLSVCPNTTQCLESRGHEATWISLAVCVVLQLLVILALGVALWRRSHFSQKHEDYFNMVGKGVSRPKHRPQLYENVRTRSETT